MLFPADSAKPPGAGTEVVVYTIGGGGHTWPGGNQDLPVGVVGKTTHNMDGGEVLWELFSRHSLR